MSGPAHGERRAVDQGALGWGIPVLCGLRSRPPDGGATVEFRSDDCANLISTNGSSHESVGKLFAQIRKSLSFLRNHGDLHLSAADGGITMPELARFVQVRDVLQGSVSLGFRFGPRDRGSGSPIAATPLPYAACVGLGLCATNIRVAGFLLKQGERRTTATPEPPPRGHDNSTWPTLPFGSAAPVPSSCFTGHGPELAVFRETAGRSRVV